MSKKYEAENIDVLDDIQHIRHVPGMFVGGANEIGLYVILKEVLDNSLDEALAGYADHITLTLDDDHKGAIVQDNGRGIPLEKHPKTKISTLATVFGIARSGAKFDGKSYNTSVGLHGVGSTATCALSELFEAWSYRGRKQGYVKFARGRLTGKDADIGPNESGQKRGTRVHLRPDFEQIFKDVKPYNPSHIKSNLEDIAFLLPGVKLCFKNNPDATEERFDNDSGILGLLHKYSGKTKFDLEPILDTVKFEVAGRDGETAVAEAEIAIGWRDQDESPLFRSYTNLSFNTDGGAHQSAFEKIITSYLVERAKNKCSAREVSDGLVGIIHLKHPSPQFSSQTKEKLINRELAKQIVDAVEPALKRWARRNAEAVDAWLAKLAERYNHRQAEKDLKAAMKDLKLTKRNSKGILPAKLYEADCKPEERELFICEGDGAAGSCVKGRNAKYQEILPIRGKVLNAMRATPAECLENKEIAAIIAAVGGGVGDGFDLKKCRVASVLLLADGDHDGLHISTLLMALLARFARPLLEAGRVYVVDAPLFRASIPSTHTRYYGHTMDELKQKAGKDWSKCEVSRLKGHGEADPAEVAEYALNPLTRKLIQLKFEQSDFDRLSLLMSDDVLARKELMAE